MASFKAVAWRYGPPVALIVCVVALAYAVWRHLRREKMTEQCGKKCNTCRTCRRTKGPDNCKQQCKPCSVCRKDEGVPNKGGGGNKDSGDGNKGYGGGGGGKGMKASYHYYDERVNFEGPANGSTISDTACADVKFSEAKLRKHHWTAIRPSSFGLSNDGTEFRKQACGKCVEVTAPSGRKGKFIVVDMKGGGDNDPGLDLSQQAYNSIGLSVAKGTDNVKARLVNC